MGLPCDSNISMRVFESNSAIISGGNDEIPENAAGFVYLFSWRLLRCCWVLPRRERCQLSALAPFPRSSRTGMPSELPR